VASAVKRYVFSLHVKQHNVSQFTTESSKLFQTRGPAQEKRSPAVDILVLGKDTRIIHTSHHHKNNLNTCLFFLPLTSWHAASDSFTTFGAIPKRYRTSVRYCHIQGLSDWFKTMPHCQIGSRRCHTVRLVQDDATHLAVNVSLSAVLTFTICSRNLHI